MHRLISLPVAGDRLGVTPDGRLVVETERLAFTVDPRTGTVEPRLPAGVEARASTRTMRHDDPALVLAAHHIRLVERETNVGLMSCLIDLDSNELAAFGGSLRSIAIGDDNIFAGSVGYPPSETVDVIAGRLGSPPVLRIPQGAGASNAGLGAVVVTGATPCALHIFRMHDGGVSRVSVARPEPEGSLGNVLVLDGEVWILAGRTLTGMALADLEGHDISIGATFMPLAPTPRSAAEYATVAFALASGTFGIDHPRFGRIVMQRAPTDPHVAKGDELALDDVIEELPSVFRVRAWHLRGSRASIQAPAPPLELPAPDIMVTVVDPERDARSAQTPPMRERGRLEPKLLELAKRHRFTAPKALVALLRASDEDAVVARWLSWLMCEPEFNFPCEDWDADPFLISFGGIGNGDAYCLYPYPPAMNENGEPPVVEFFHETNLAELRASNFDDFFSSFLAERAADEDAEVVNLLVSRLGLPSPNRATPPSTPEWLPTYETNDELIVKADQLIEEGELILAERVLVSRWLGHDGTPNDEIRRRLEELYERLSWSLPLEVLRAGR